MGYDYYEFATVDRRLSEQAMENLRDLERKAVVTPATFSLTTYNESFSADPDTFLRQYFDAYIHVGKYGLREVKFKFPRHVVDLKAWQPYLAGEDLACQVKGDAAILTMRTDREGGGWENGEGWLAELLPCRTDLIEGDLRPLYLGWLGVLEYGASLEDDDLEPPVPPGLATLPDPQKALVNYLNLDWTLVDAAAEAVPQAPVAPGRDEMAAWIAGLPQGAKDAWLTRWILDDDASARLEVLGRFREEQSVEAGPQQPRSVADLLNRWGELHEEAENRERQEAAQRRMERLKSLAEDVPGAWRLVDHLLEDNHWKRRDQAIELLLQLKEISNAQGTDDGLKTQMVALRNKYKRRPALLTRFDQEELP